MTNPVIEIVNFKLAENITPEAFLAAASASTDFVKAQPGFKARRLSMGEDGRWLEHIEWDTMAAARAASEAMMQDASLGAFMQSIDMDSIEMRHHILQISEG